MTREFKIGIVASALYLVALMFLLLMDRVPSYDFSSYLVLGIAAIWIAVFGWRWIKN
jgi:hypothetical protein